MNTVFLHKPNQYQENLNGFILKLGFILLLCCNNVFAGNINLAWDPSPSTGVGGYKLYYGSSSKTYSQNIDVGNKTSYTMTGLTDGATYYVSLKAYNTAKSIESSYSNEVSAKVAATTTGTWTQCAIENGTCAVSGKRNVLYGTSTTSTTAIPGVASGSVPCTNAAFGKDPAPSNVKKCWVSSSTTTASVTVPVNTTATWTQCAKENQTCTVSGTRNVLYGTSITATTTIRGVASGSVPCTNKAFGKDPVYGTVKTCWVSNVTTTAAISVPVKSTTTANAIASTTSTTSSTTAPTTSVNGLVAAYSFDDFGGAMTADASRQGNHGVINGATRTSSGYFGNALQFNGTNNWVTVNDSASLDLTSGMTLEAWVKPANLNGWRTILTKELSTNDVVYSFYASDDMNKPVMGQWTNGSVKPLSGVSSLTANTWSHLTATYDGQTQRLYVNGVQVSQRAQTGAIQTSNNVMRIGGNSIWGEYFQGTIDEVRVYNRALSSTEVGTDYKTAVGTSNPVQSVVGNKSLETNVATNAQGQSKAFKTIPANKAVLTAIQVYLDGSSTATELVAGIYSDNAGHPGTLITQGKITSPKAGATNTVPVNTTTLDAAKPYWIAILGSKGQIKYRAKLAAANPAETSASTVLTSLPSQWATGKVFPNDGPFSIYGTGY
jgi:Concanavalin A-like lectin/glucanases superfamily/Fibronectin type III domain